LESADQNVIYKGNLEDPAFSADKNSEAVSGGRKTGKMKTQGAAPAETS
jgi:hypothetical protein